MKLGGSNHVLGGENMTFQFYIHSVNGRMYKHSETTFIIIKCLHQLTEHCRSIMRWEVDGRAI